MAIVRGSIVVAMVAVDDMGGHKLVDDSRDNLDANEACSKEAHHDETGSLIGPTLLLKVFFGLGEHAEQGGEKLEVEETGAVVSRLYCIIGEEVEAVNEDSP